MKKIIFIALLALLFSGWGCQKKENVSVTNTNSVTNFPTNSSSSSRKYLWSQQEKSPYWHKISYATSNNLLNWTDSQKILVEHSSVPDAVYKDGVIYLYFVDVSEDGKPEQIALLRSSDNGQTFEEKEIVQFEGLEGKVPVDPSPFLLKDGRIRLYYYDIEGSRTQLTGIHKIYSAISSDGLHFTQEDGVRFAKECILDPTVIQVGSTYHLYAGDPCENKEKVVAALSSDGLNFTDEGVVWEGSMVPEVFYDGNKYYLYTNGIAIATSSDGKIFQNTNFSFRSKSYPLAADPSIIQLNDGTYLLFYKVVEKF